ncbi:hypothetical protein HPB48_011278 [Haemaphysalis longicornis]|uniref:Secreted protein n=1 Tax=Haemaphysalis longicornis TaxID=44386 RepID=A0A9J6G595_HAELO|nr:hypothetical protein HPB48_011278 [Haemaphysalis longicornis]
MLNAVYYFVIFCAQHCTANTVNPALPDVIQDRILGITTRSSWQMHFTDFTGCWHRSSRQYFRLEQTSTD